MPEFYTRNAAFESNEQRGAPIRLPDSFVMLPSDRLDESALMLQPVNDVMAFASDKSILLWASSQEDAGMKTLHD